MRTIKCSLVLAALLVIPALSAAQVRETPEPMLEQRVGEALFTVPNLSLFDNVTFQVYGDTVDLGGQATSLTLKNNAEGVVRRVTGVNQVNNHIEVLPLSPSDDAIRMATLRAVYGDPALSRESLGPIPPIRIIVRNGNVMLVGMVASEVQRYDAYVRASNVPGVVSVTNNLQVG